MKFGFNLGIDVFADASHTEFVLNSTLARLTKTMEIADLKFTLATNDATHVSLTGDFDLLPNENSETVSFDVLADWGTDTNVVELKGTLAQWANPFHAQWLSIKSAVADLKIATESPAVSGLTITGDAELKFGDYTDSSQFDMEFTNNYEDVFVQFTSKVCASSLTHN